MQLRDWLEAEPFTLTLSSGFFSFFAHCGMLSVLEEEGLLPARLTGSSAGALVAGCWGAGMSTAEIRDLFFSVDKPQFWDPGFGLGLLKGDKFRHLLRAHLPVQRLEQCRVPVAVSVYEWRSKQVHSYEQGDLATIVSASCSVPWLFQPVRHNGYSYLDGGVKDRPGLHAVDCSERVFYHHIASRSPWRRKSDPALQIPERENLAALVIHNLVRSGPNKLDKGPQAYAQAREATRRALSQSLDNRATLAVTAQAVEQINA